LISFRILNNLLLYISISQLNSTACLAEKREAYGILVGKTEGKRGGWKLGVDGRIALKYGTTA
jgi:hypothetical protein